MQYTDNAIWIENANSLTNYASMIPILVDKHIKYAICFVGGWNCDVPAAPTITFNKTDQFYSDMCNAFRAGGITPIAWAEVGGGQGSGTADVAEANWAAYNAQVALAVSKGFDGYSEDIEVYSNSATVWIAYLNQQYTWLHAAGKLCMPAVAANTGGEGGNKLQYIHVDQICIMFYWADSLFEQGDDADDYWMEQFGLGIYNAFGTPGSPVLFGIINNANADKPLSWQLTQFDTFMSTLGFGSAVILGISHFSWEKMGAVNSSDWADWVTWLDFPAASVSASFASATTRPPASKRKPTLQASLSPLNCEIVNLMIKHLEHKIKLKEELMKYESLRG